MLQSAAIPSTRPPSGAPPEKKPRTEAESRIRVVVRKRPLSRREAEETHGSVLETPPAEPNKPQCLIVHQPQLKVDMTAYVDTHKFLYDAVYDDATNNEAVYHGTAAPLISRLFASGLSSTCFAYGATGSGKTHTMLGSDDEPGLYVLAAADIFTMLQQPQHALLGLYAASFEIYGGKEAA